MTRFLERYHRVRDRRATGDEGFSLIELIVAMGIFTTVIAVFMSGIMVMFRDTNRTQAAAANTDNLRSVFVAMDKQVRYADGMNVPGAVGARWFVEFRTPQDGGLPSTCYQWRYDTSAGTLAWRSWTATAAVPAASSGWRQVAAGLATGDEALKKPDGTAVKPFTMLPAALVSSGTTGSVTGTVTGTVATAGSSAAADPNLTSQLRQRLVVSVNSGRGDGQGEQLQTTFVAVNSNVNSPGNLSQGSSGASSDNPVCSPSSARS